MQTTNQEVQAHSMTGFGLETEHFDWGSLTVEFRSVNSRFLELHFKMPDQWRATELQLRELMQKHLKRGKVECRLSSKANANHEPEGPLSGIKLEQIGSWQTQIQARFPNSDPLSVSQILALAKATGGDSDGSELLPSVVGTAQKAIDALVASRQREGVELDRVLRQGLNQLRAIVDPLAEQMPQIVEAQQKKQSEKLLLAFTQVQRANAEGYVESNSLANVSLDEIMIRVRQEVSALGLRADVAEELARLNAHIKEFERCLNAAGPHGKRLDFLIQELNREANTIGSKSLSLISTHAALGLKQVIEQLREQIQNLE